MAMTKLEFDKAFREAVSLEFAHIPTDENSIDYTFSEKFNKRMEKLIRSQKRVSWKLVNSVAKRVAVACIIMLTMLTTACSVKVIREPIVQFFTEIYETFAQYFFVGSTTDAITHVYTIKELPEGFKETNKIQDDVSVTTIYETESGDLISFAQTVTGETQHNMDTEKDTVFTEEINGIEVNFYEAHDLKQAMWVNDDYYFKITCHGNVSMDNIKQMIASAEKISIE